MKSTIQPSCYFIIGFFLLSLSKPQLSFAQAAGYSGTGANIDVKYHRAEWTINPNIAKNITGVVTTYFKTTQANVSQITFDLNGAHAFSATYHGSSITTSRPSSNVIQLTLPATLPINTLDSVKISYSGTPPVFDNYGEGFERKSITGMGNVIYTLSESYGDEDWWPCKADMQDKIDSIDIIITTPSAFMAATNGMLISNTISGSNRILTYKHRYPIASYLVAVGVAQYNVFDRGTVNINGTNVPIEYFIYAGRGANPTTQLTAMDFCKQELVAFSDKFGDYPFKTEKYGMYEFGWGGGMEHQTFSAMGWSTMSSWSVIAHELAHQWFGDKVTFATWNHLWLAEGFAKYSEVLAAELVPALGRNPVTHRAGIKSTALSTSTTPVYLSAASIANSNTIWTTSNDNAIYQRGAMVVSMLRKLAGDTKFYMACRNYLNDPALAYRSATTDDLKNHFEAVLGYGLDAFFTDYIMGTGNPVYSIRWGNNGTNFNLQVLSQSRSSGSTVSYFQSPVVVKVSNGSTDTTLVVYDQEGQLSYAGNGISSPYSRNTLSYKLSFVPTTVTYDPDSETLTTGSVAKDNALNNVAYAPLPIDIMDFNAIPKDDHNLLTLFIAPTNEYNLLEAQRSENGSDFTSMGSMTQSEMSQTKLAYQYQDRNIQPSRTYYYRVKTTDEAGVVMYSKIARIVNQDENGVIRMSPNPADKQVHIQWIAAPGIRNETEIQVTNMNGQVLLSQKVFDNYITINTGTMPAGTYLVQAKQSNVMILSRKLIIRR